MADERPAEWWPELGPKWEPTTAEIPTRRVIDVHTHLKTPEAAAIANEYFEPAMDPRTFFSDPESIAYNTELRATQVDKFETGEGRLADMDNQGVDMQVMAIAPPHYFYWLNDEVGPRVNAMSNDRIAQVVTDHPTRFVGVGTLPMDHPDKAVIEMKRIKRDLGFNGFEISADINGKELDDRRLDPIWAAAEEEEMTIILHPQGFTHGERMSDYYLINVVCMPLASTLTVSRMILGGVWERFPDLKMIVVHGGGYLPFYFSRTDHAFGIRPEMRKHIDRLPSEYLHKLYFDTAVFKPEMVEYQVKEFGADHVLMGTDYPFDMGPTDPLAFLQEARLNQSERDSIVGGNAERLFKIPPAK